MIKRVLNRYVFKVFSFSAVKRPARGCEQYFFKRISGRALQGLKNRGVLAVHRQKLNACFFKPAVYDFPARYKRFLICKGNGSALVYRRQRGSQPRNTHNRIKHGIAIALRRGNNALFARIYLNICIGKLYFKLGCGTFIKHCDKLRLKFSRLRFGKLYVSARRQRRYFPAVFFAGFKRLRTY